MRFTCACTALYHSSMLLFPWQKLVNRSSQAHTLLDCGLQKFSNLSQIVSRFISSLDSTQDTYWSIPKSPDHVITFLHFWHLGRAVRHLGRAVSSHSKIFSHLSFHLRNLWYNALLTVQSISGPLMYGIYMLV